MGNNSVEQGVVFKEAAKFKGGPTVEQRHLMAGFGTCCCCPLLDWWALTQPGGFLLRFSEKFKSVGESV